jgi:hypothetical protein
MENFDLYHEPCEYYEPASMEDFYLYEDYDSALCPNSSFLKTEAWKTEYGWRNKLLDLGQSTQKELSEIEKRREEMLKNWNEELRKALMC